MATAIKLPPVPFTGNTSNWQNDIIPSIHLRRWAVPGLKIVDIIGDSTGTELPAANYSLDPTQTIWGALKAEIVRRNPQNTYVFNNRAISSSNWAWPMQSANQIGILQPLPDWYTDRDKVWIDYVKDNQPDTLFILLGTNAPQSGQTAGSSVATFINDVFTYIGSWVKVPDIVILTTKIANANAGPPYSDQESYKAMQSFLRTFARSNGEGYAAFPRIKYVGLIDLGRQYAMRALGRDYAYQYLSQVPTALHNGYTLVGPYPGTVTTIGESTDGDLSVSLTFHGMGGTAMYAALGAGGFFIGCTGFVGNRIQITLGSTGVWAPHYQLIGINGDPSLTGVAYKPPAGDVTMTVTLKGDLVRILVNDTYIIDTSAPRLIQNCTVTIGSGITPNSPVTFDVTQFLEGIATPSYNMLDPSICFGYVGGPQAGNDINHPSSSTVAQVDWMTIAATNLAAPQPTAIELQEDEVQIFSDPTSVSNVGTINVEEILKTAPINANQLLHDGDYLEAVAWGNNAATTDNKTINLRWGGLTGAITAQSVTASASGLRWYLVGRISRRSPNVQVLGGRASVSNTNYSTAGTAAANPDLSPTTLVITSVNASNTAAASITCEYFAVNYIKAPGT